MFGKRKQVFTTTDLTSGIENGKFQQNLSMFYIPNKVLAIDQNT